MTFHTNLGSNIGRFAGGFADFITGDRFDFDKRGRGFRGAENLELLEKEEVEEDKGKGMLDKFLGGVMSYDPEKNKTESDKLLAMASKGGLGGGSFQQIGNLALYTPDNSAREQAILQQNQFNAQQALQKKQNKTRFAGGVGTAIGTAVGGPVGGLIGGAIGKLFCDIRLKEDIAPLCESEVNDVLSECAFFVKDLNECS